jgi:phosphoglycolate phosphatase
MPNGKFDTIIFDLDGTLVDSAPDLANALNQVLTDADRPSLTVPQVAKMVGNGIAVLVERGFTATGGLPDDLPHKVEQFRSAYTHVASDRTIMYPGVIETLTLLRGEGYCMAVCTNKPIAATNIVLNALNLTHYFDAVSGGDTFAVRKPDPDHVLGTLEMLGSSAEHSVMIGDSINDVAAATGAGLAVVAVSYGYTRTPAHELGADLVIDTFDAFPAAIAELTSRVSEPVQSA